MSKHESIDGGMFDNVTGVDGWKAEVESLAFAGCTGYDHGWGEDVCTYVIDKLIDAVRKDERQKMHDLWKGMLP